MSRKTVLLWLLAGLGGLAVFVRFYDFTETAASVKIKVGRTEAVQEAREFIRELGFDVTDYRKTINFGSCESIIFLQKNFGVRKTNELFETRIPCWTWRIDFFKELQKERFWVGVDPATGAITYFYHALPDDALGAQLSQDKARMIAEGILARQNEDLGQYFLGQNNTNRFKNRTDHSFVWSRKDDDLNGGKIQVAVHIYGNRLGFYSKYLRIPEGFEREFVKTEMPGAVLMFIFGVCIFLLAVFAIVTLVVQHKNSRILWKLGLGLGFLLLPAQFLSFFNAQESVWSGYSDKVSFDLYYLFAFAMTAVMTVYGGLTIFLFFTAGESLSHSLNHDSFPILGKLGREKINFKDACQRILVGYGLGFWGLGYATLFYLLAEKYLSVWKPLSPEYSDILSTSMPFLFPLTVALFAALSEESMSRLFTVSLFRKYFKNTAVAVVLSAAIWGMGHSSYAVFPMYVRAIELTVVGIIWAVVYLRYGLETVIVAHYAYNAVAVGIPLLRSGNPYFVGSGIAVICLMALPVALIPLLNSRALERVFRWRFSSRQIWAAVGAVMVGCTVLAGLVLFQSWKSKFQQGIAKPGEAVSAVPKIPDDYRYTPEVEALAQKGYQLFKESKIKGKYDGGYFSDPIPEAPGYEFWFNGRQVHLDRDSNGHYETIFNWHNEGTELLYMGSVGGNGLFVDVGKGFESYWGRTCTQSLIKQETPEKISEKPKIPDDYHYTPEVERLAQEGYRLFKEKKFISHFKDGHYTDPDPFGQGFEFWSNGKKVILDRDHDGFHETTFMVQKDGTLLYVGSLGSKGVYVDAGKGFEASLGSYADHPFSAMGMDQSEEYNGEIAQDTETTALFQVAETRKSFSPRRELEEGDVILIEVDNIQGNEALRLDQCASETGCSSANLVQSWGKMDITDKKQLRIKISQQGRYYFWLQNSQEAAGSSAVIIKNFVYIGNKLQMEFSSGSLMRVWDVPQNDIPDLTEFWAHNTRGNAYRSLGKYPEALQEYREMINIYPEHPISYNAIDWTYTLIAKERPLTPEEDQDRKHNLELIIQNVKPEWQKR